MLFYGKICSKLPSRCVQKSMYVGLYVLSVHYLCHDLTNIVTSQ